MGKPTSFFRCPGGHKLPHEVNGIECSSAECAAAPRAGAPPEPPTRKDGKTPTPGAFEEAHFEKTLNLRKKLVPRPEGLEGADAEAHVERKLVELSVHAVAELEWALKYGADKERMDAARDILNATGHGKKERVSQAANLIVINLGRDAEGKRPPLPYATQVVEAATKLLPQGSTKVAS